MRAVVMATGLAMGLALAAAHGVVPVPPAQAQSRPNNLFTEAGFQVRHADTPQKRAMLERLPADKLVKRKRDGKIYYIYADPKGCRCAYVGTPAAYAAFQRGGPPAFAPSGDGTSRGERLIEEMADDDAPEVAGEPGDMDYIFGGF